jgi:hypothetical protein
VPGFPPDAEEPPVLDWPPEPGVPPDAPPWAVFPPEPLPPDPPSVLDEHAAAVIASMVTKIRHVDIRSLQARVLGKQVEEQWQRETTSVTRMRARHLPKGAKGRGEVSSCFSAPLRPKVWALSDTLSESHGRLHVAVGVEPIFDEAPSSLGARPQAGADGMVSTPSGPDGHLRVDESWAATD